MEQTKLIDQIYVDVKKRILSGELKEHTKVSERFLCDEYETSRTTVRSAINKLRSDNWLYVQPKSGTFVAPVDAQAIKDNFQLRMLLEPNMILMAMPNLDSEDFVCMRNNCECMERDRHVGYGNCETDNHRIIAEKTRNQKIIRIFEDMMDDMLRITARSSIEEKRQTNSIMEWRNIITAMEKGDGYLASQLMQYHIMNASDAFWKNFGLE